MEEYGEPRLIDKAELAERTGCGDMVAFVLCVWLEGGCITGKKITTVSSTVTHQDGAKGHGIME